MYIVRYPEGTAGRMTVRESEPNLSGFWNQICESANLWQYRHRFRGSKCTAFVGRAFWIQTLTTKTGPLPASAKEGRPADGPRAVPLGASAGRLALKGSYANMARPNPAGSLE